MNVVFALGVVITLVTLIPVAAQLRHHPRGLAVLFFAEMWERFSYYGMRALLVFYLTQHFLFDDRTAASRYAAYTTLISLVPIVGALVADRLIGTRKAVAFGALLLVAGHLTMAFEGPPARNVLTWHGQAYSFQAQGRATERDVRLVVGDGAYEVRSAPDGGLVVVGLPATATLPARLAKGDYSVSVEGRSALHSDLLFLALALIVMGVSFLKTSPLLAQLYAREDSRRDAGFTLFYYGVNLGAFWAGVLCGWAGTAIGWWAGFGLAAVGMTVGYVVFVLGKPWLDGKGEPPDSARLAKPLVGPLNREGATYLGAILGVVPLSLLIRANAALGPLLGAVSFTSLGYLGFYMAKRCTPVERRRLGLALVLMLGSIAFWSLFEQGGSSLNLFADRNTALNVIDAPIRIPVLGQALVLGSRAALEAADINPAAVWWIDTGLSAPQTQSFNPGFILLLAPVFAGLWPWLERGGRNPTPMAKFGLALLLVGAGFLLLSWGGFFADEHFRVPLVFLLGAYFLNTVGELCLSPVGVSVVSRLAPPAMIAFLLAMWSLSVSWAQFIGGKIAALAATDTIGGQVLDPRASLQTVLQTFAWIGLAGLICGAVFLAAGPLVRAWGEGLDDPNHQSKVPKS